MTRSEHTILHNKLRRGKHHWHLSEETKRKMSENNVGSKGMHWFNNGTTDVFAYECPDGYVKGRLKGNNPYRDSKGRYAIKETLK